MAIRHDPWPWTIRVIGQTRGAHGHSQVNGHWPDLGHHPDPSEWPLVRPSYMATTEWMAIGETGSDQNWPEIYFSVTSVFL
jgi:hypothetical protein